MKLYFKRMVKMVIYMSIRKPRLGRKARLWEKVEAENRARASPTAQTSIPSLFA